MRDLVVITADADMKAVMEAVLKRPQSLGIRPLDFEVRKHDGRDAGVFHHGPEFARLHKSAFSHLLMLWDHHGSGQEHQGQPGDAARQVQSRLDVISWRDRSGAVVLRPELEEWLWHGPNAVAKWLGVSDSELLSWQSEFAAQASTTPEQARDETPKELLQFVSRRRWRRRLRVQDYSIMAGAASLTAWQSSHSFQEAVRLLQAWFPVQP